MPGKGRRVRKWLGQSVLRFPGKGRQRVFAAERTERTEEGPAGWNRVGGLGTWGLSFFFF